DFSNKNIFYKNKKYKIMDINQTQQDEYMMKIEEDENNEIKENIGDGLIIPVENQSVRNMIYLGKDQNIYFKDKQEYFRSELNLLDIVKYPRIIDYNFISADRSSKLRYVVFNRKIICIILIRSELSVQDMFSHTKRVEEYIDIHTDNIRIHNHIINNNILVIDQFRMELRDEEKIRNVYIAENKDGLYFLEKIVNNDRIEIYKEKRSYFKIYFTVFICLLLFMLFRTHNLMKRKELLEERNGFKIYFGEFDKQMVLIKTFDVNDNRAEKEINILREHHHQNIIKYIYSEKSRKEISLILKFHKTRLCDVDMEIFKPNIIILVELLYFLHSKNIFYNNIHPSNIYIENDTFYLSNFEDSISIKENEICKEEVTGIIGYRSKELIEYCNHNIDLSFDAIRKIDIFSLGILIHQVLYKEHPFQTAFHGRDDENILREEKIMENNYTLKTIDNYTLNDLIHNMLKTEYSERFDIQQVKNHPYFWSNEKIFNFFCNISDYLENRTDESVNTKRLFKRLERNKFKVFTDSWSDSLDESIKKDLFSFRHYSTTIKAMLRSIRNKGRHYKELPEDIKSIYKGFPDGYVNYYLEKFPTLLIVCYHSAKSEKDDELLREFY
ncbi:Serine/threonine-protein kinase, partial [Spraguea lophii 42_110]